MVSSGGEVRGEGYPDDARKIKQGGVVRGRVRIKGGVGGKGKGGKER